MASPVDPTRLAPNYRRRSRLVQPNFNRDRAAYRSPMSSERMNLEAEQLRFDLSNLRALTERVKDSLENDLQLVDDGATVRWMHSAEAATPSFRLLESLKQISANIQLIKDMVRRLEIIKGINQ